MHVQSSLKYASAIEEWRDKEKRFSIRVNGAIVPLDAWTLLNFLLDSAPANEKDQKKELDGGE